MALVHPILPVGLQEGGMSIQLREWRESLAGGETCFTPVFWLARMNWDSGDLWILEEQGLILLAFLRKDKPGKDFT